LVAAHGGLVHGEDRAAGVVNIRYQFAYVPMRIRDHPFRIVTKGCRPGFGRAAARDRRLASRTGLFPIAEPARPHARLALRAGRRYMSSDFPDIGRGAVKSS
jgi:hypothetical protein